MEKRLIASIRMAASKLKGGKLRNLKALAPVLGAIREAASLSADEEAVAMAVIMDRQCSDNSTNLADMADYFNCTTLEAMEYAPAIKALQAKGYIKADEADEYNITKMAFKLTPVVFANVLEGRDPSAGIRETENTFDQYDYCRAIDNYIQARRRGNMDTATLFNQTLIMEERHARLPFVAQVKALLSQLGDRLFFYEACHDFQRDSDGGSSHLKETLDDIYDRKADFLAQLRRFKERTHPLLSIGLVALQSAHIELTDKGIGLLFGKDAVIYQRVKGGLNRYEFVREVNDYTSDVDRNPKIYEIDNLMQRVSSLEAANAGLGFLEKLQALLPQVEDRTLFYLIGNELLDGNDFELFQLCDIAVKSEEMRLRRLIKNKQHPLQRTGLAVLSKDEMFGNAIFNYTEKGKRLYLEDDYDLFCGEMADNDLIASDKIAPKRLFFDGDTERQLRSLAGSLEESNYKALCGRLVQNHLPKGITVLLYGHPGTGKTESVLQIARATGRAIFHVDISATKSCWFGESEKRIKGVFDDYRKLCENREVKPILLFNEADAIFAKRKDTSSSNVAQTENAIQNIILEEMEQLDGILIATTNLADNLDTAFDRRFLFKIRFDKPDVEAKKQIWLSKLPAISPELAARLATRFDLSGGEIDNITRKVVVEELIKGEKITEEALITLCKDEKPATDKRKIGF